jgi:hypothetical protein
MPGLVPGIHVLWRCHSKDVDGRDKPGYDESKDVDARAKRGHVETKLFEN